MMKNLLCSLLFVFTSLGYYVPMADGAHCLVLEEERITRSTVESSLGEDDLSLRKGTDDSQVVRLRRKDEGNTNFLEDERDSSFVTSNSQDNMEDKLPDDFPQGNIDLNSYSDKVTLDQATEVLPSEMNILSWLTSEKGIFGPEYISTTLKTLLITSAFSLAPALLLITTSYIRISVVFSLLRQAIGAGQIPSNQIISVLSIFLTVLIMAPVWTSIYEKAVVPYSSGMITNIEALELGQSPIRTFILKQIESTGGTEAISLFLRYIPESEIPEYIEDVPWRVLAPAYVLSELKTAFLIGFQLFIPFLIIDIIVSSVLVSSGMMMLPPAIVSLPFKLALFVLVDGWSLVVKSLLESFV